MKVLITTQSLIMGGIETALLSLLKFLHECQVEVDLYALEGGVLSDEFKKLNNVNFIPVKVPKNKMIYRIMKNLRCTSLYKTYQKQNTKEYDAAIAFYGINNYSDLYAASVNAKKKLIWVHMNFDALYHRSNYKGIIKLRNNIMRKKFQYFDHIVAVSESSKNGFLKVFGNYEDKTLVINNFMDLSRLEKKDEPCETLVGENKLIYVGRLADEKRVDILIREFGKVLDEIPNSYLYIVGDGPEKVSLENVVLQLKLGEKVRFLGNQNNPFKYMRQADMVVTASENEAYSITSLEALAMNKYFVSASNEGAEDIFYLTNQAKLNNGIVCKPKYMHKHIIYYLKNKDKIKPNFDMKQDNKRIEAQLMEILNIKIGDNESK